MPNIFETGASERRLIDFSYFDKDGDAKDLTGYTISPFLYETGTNTIYKSGADAGTLSWVAQSSGTFSFLPAASIFISGRSYDLFIQFTSGDEVYKIKVGLIIKVR